jgi:hypothetical protein
VYVHTDRTTLTQHGGRHIPCVYVWKDEEDVASGGEMYPGIGSLFGQGQEFWIAMIVYCQWHNKVLWIWNRGGK